MLVKVAKFAAGSRLRTNGITIHRLYMRSKQNLEEALLLHCNADCKLISDALLEYDQSVQIAVSTLTPFPPGTTVSNIIKDGKASYVKGDWAAASRIEMYTDMSKGQIISSGPSVNAIWSGFKNLLLISDPEEDGYSIDLT
jgi:hypothetical protein